MQRDPKSGLSKAFSVAHDLTEQQKRDIEINNIRDNRERDELRKMDALKREKTKVAREETERQKEAVVQRELKKRTEARAEMNLVMKDADRKKNPREIEQELRAKVQKGYGPELDNHVRQVERDMDNVVRKELREATFRDNKPEVTRQQPEQARSRDNFWNRNQQSQNPTAEPSKKADRDFWNKPKPSRNSGNAPEIKRDFNNSGRDRER